MADKTEKDAERSAALRKAYGDATSELRAAHHEEFTALLAAKYAAAGLEVRPRLSAEERAEKEAAEAQVRAEKAERKRLEKIAKLQAEIAALAGESDPLDVFREPAA
jgi:hypothetical protein